MGKQAAKNQICAIGKITKYIGLERRYLTNSAVQIVAIFKDALKPGVKVHRLNTDNQVQARGGVSQYDRIQVCPVINGTKSLVLVDVVAIDLECYSDLRAKINIRWI